MRLALRTRAACKIAAVLVVPPLTLAPFAAAGPAGALPKQAAPNTVEALIESKFAPDTLTVPVGTTVTWLNKGGSHTVVGGDGVIDPASPIGENPLANEGDKVEKTFDKPGTYPYFCQPHVSLGMKGTIIVTAAAGGAASSPPAPSGSTSETATPASAAPGASGVSSASPPIAGTSATGSAAASSPAASGSGAVVTGSPNPGTPDPSLGAVALEKLDLKLEKESHPLTTFRLALWALTLGIFLLGAAVYFVTKPRRDSE
ncbi:MAG: plastocyanin/azurin family copper-binding protein [Actinomycetota bacterium]